MILSNQITHKLAAGDDAGDVPWCVITGKPQSLIQIKYVWMSLVQIKYVWRYFKYVWTYLTQIDSKQIRVDGLFPAST